MSSNPYRDYITNFINNLPSGVTYDSTIGRFFYNEKRFLNPKEVQWYIDYLNKTSGAPDLSAAPVASGGLVDVVVTEDSAITTIDVAADFTGTGITYALAPSSAALPSGLSLSSAGQITGTPTTATALRTIVVRGTNGGGFDDTAFDITIEAVSGDTTAPTAASVTVGPQTGIDIPLAVEDLTEDSTMFVNVVPAGSTAPTEAEIIAGEASGGGAPSDSLEISVTPDGGLYTPEFTIGLNALFDVRVLFRDAAGNTSNIFLSEDVPLDTRISFQSAIAGFDDPVESRHLRYDGNTRETLYGNTFEAGIQSIDSVFTDSNALPITVKSNLNAAGQFVVMFDVIATSATTNIEANAQGSTIGAGVSFHHTTHVVTVNPNADGGGAVDVSAQYGAPAETVWRLYVVYTQTAVGRVYHEFNTPNQAGDRHRNWAVFQRATFDADDAIMETQIGEMPIRDESAAAPPAEWDITDNGDGTFTIASHPPIPSAPTLTDNGDGTFNIAA